MKNVNSGKCIGVPGSSTANGTVLQQLTTIGDNTKWKLQYELAGEYFKFYPKSGVNNLALSIASSGDNLVQRNDVVGPTNRDDVWHVYYMYKYTPRFFLDWGYYYNYGEESLNSSQTRIETYQDYINEIYNYHFGLNFETPYFQRFSSIIDNCMGATNLSTWQQTGYRCNNIAHYSLISGYCHENSALTYHFLLPLNTNHINKMIRVLWSGNEVLYNGDINRSYAMKIFQYILMLERTTGSNRDYDSKNTLLHEMGHMFDANDHYCEEDFDPKTKKCSITNSEEQNPRKKITQPQQKQSEQQKGRKTRAKRRSKKT